MALKDLFVSGREAQLMKENARLRTALRSARYDLLQAAKEIERELNYEPPTISNGHHESP